MLDAFRCLMFVVCLSSSGCAVSASLRAVEEGRLAGVDKMVEDELRRGRFDAGDAENLAEEVLAYEIAHAKGSKGAARIEQMESCARELEDALEARMAQGGEPGAAAAMVLLEAGLAERGSFAGWVKDERAMYRAVGARALVWPEDARTRRALFLDGDQEVRLAALRAATDGPDPRDTEAVLEAARLDPYPMARTQAVRAAGAIGGERVVLALKDLWVLADERLREAIADAWARPRALVAGGRQELAWAAETQGGTPAVAAAYGLLRSPKGPGYSEAVGVLTRAIENGAWRERIFAISVADMNEPSLRAAVVEAVESSDDPVAWTALRRLVETKAELGGARGQERTKWMAKLFELANKGTRTEALTAQLTLARVDEKKVIPLLSKSAKAADARARKVAGISLAELGELPRAAVLAGDKDADVRIAVSCAILRKAARQ